MGEGIVRGWGENLTGRFAEDIPGGGMLERLEQCVRTRKPYYSQGPLIWAVHNFRSFAVLVMPFAGHDGAVKRLLVYNEFE